MNLELKIENKDWKFKRHPHDCDSNGIQYIFEFKNGYGASVIKMRFSYGYAYDLWELAVLKNGKIHYDNTVANGDVRGGLTDEEVNSCLREIESFKEE